MTDQFRLAATSSLIFWTWRNVCNPSLLKLDKRYHTCGAHLLRQPPLLSFHRRLKRVQTCTLWWLAQDTGVEFLG